LLFGIGSIALYLALAKLVIPRIGA